MVRALGPGSVSSFLKVILDVVYVVLWGCLGLLALVLVAAILFAFNPALLPGVKVVNAEGIDLADRGPLIVGALAAASLYVGGVLLIVGTLRRIFVTLTVGDPFHPNNVRRLRVVGLLLAALELGRYLFWVISTYIPDVKEVDSNFSLTTWFSVLVVFVLAEVFREGARLRREAELTI